MTIATNLNYSLNDAFMSSRLSQIAYNQDVDALRHELNALGWELIGTQQANADPYFPEGQGNVFAFTAKQVTEDGTQRYAIGFRGTDDFDDFVYNNFSQWGFTNYLDP